MKILVIDDEPDVRHIAQLSLTAVGKMEVVVAASAEEGIRAATDHTIDAILLDVSMPGIDGPATLRLLRANEATAAIPVIFITAKAMSRELDALRGLGVVGVITKPFQAMELPAQVRALLAETFER